jgi:FdhD protein
MKESWHAERIVESEEFWQEERLDPAAAFQTTRCIEISGSGRRKQKVDVAIEERIKIVIDGTAVAELFCLPSELEELAVGFLVCEGLVEGPEDIVSVRAEGKCLICERRGQKVEKDFHWVVSDLKMSPEAIFGALDLLNEGAHLWRRTGGTHSALVLREDGDIASFCEDVSRSSAVDKAVGSALLAGADPSRCALITTGRLSSVIVSKAARAGFPIVVSRAAPLNAGIDLAKRLGMTLAAFARRPKLYVYSGDGRIS